jgi:hypothetical protein
MVISATESYTLQDESETLGAGSRTAMVRGMLPELRSNEMTAGPEPARLFDEGDFL